MSRFLNNVEDICRLSLPKRFTLPLQNVDDVILYDGFIVCIERHEFSHLIVVFDRITSRKVTMLQIEYRSNPLRLFRLHKWSIGYCDYDKSAKDGNIYHCHLYPFSIGKAAIVEKHKPILLMSVPLQPVEVKILTSRDELNRDVAALIMRFVGHTHDYDISGTNVFPVNKSPTFNITKGNSRFLVGQNLWARYDPEGMKQYNLSSGAILSSQIDWTLNAPVVYRNKFLIGQDGPEWLRIVNSATGEEAIRRIPKFKRTMLAFRDIVEDGCVLVVHYVDEYVKRREWRYRTGNLTAKLVTTFRLDVPSLSDIAKEWIHKHTVGGAKTDMSDAEDTSEDEEDEEEEEDEEGEDGEEDGGKGEDEQEEGEGETSEEDAEKDGGDEGDGNKGQPQIGNGKEDNKEEDEDEKEEDEEKNDESNNLGEGQSQIANGEDMESDDGSPASKRTRN